MMIMEVMKTTKPPRHMTEIHSHNTHSHLSRLGLGASIKPATVSETIKAKIGGKLHRAAQKHKNDEAESSESSSGKHFTRYDVM